MSMRLIGMLKSHDRRAKMQNEKISISDKIAYYAYKTLFYFTFSAVSYFMWDAIRTILKVK